MIEKLFGELRKAVIWRCNSRGMNLRSHGGCRIIGPETENLLGDVSVLVQMSILPLSFSLFNPRPHYKEKKSFYDFGPGTLHLLKN